MSKRAKTLKRQKQRAAALKTVRVLPKLANARNQYSSHPFYSSEFWLRLRYRVLVKRGRRCEACGAVGLNYTFHVDHIKPRSQFPELQLLESNLQVLCEACNLGKGAWDQTDWRVTGTNTPPPTT